MCGAACVSSEVRVVCFALTHKIIVPDLPFVNKSDESYSSVCNQNEFIVKKLAKSLDL